jgi:hypothetical protein
MKVSLYGKIYDVKIDYRFNGADIDSINNAIKYNCPIRVLTRIKIYHYVINKLTIVEPFMCNHIKHLINDLLKTSKYITNLYNYLPEFTKDNYRKLIKVEYPFIGTAWDHRDKVKERIKFIKHLKLKCIIEYYKYKIH